MAPRVQLQTLLETLMGNKGKVYFQPPDNLTIQYPCIIYERDQARNHFADNFPYNHTKRYLVTIIDPNPDSDIPDKVSQLPMSTYSRGFATDNLTHDIFYLYF